MLQVVKVLRMQDATSVQLVFSSSELSPSWARAKGRKGHSLCAPTDIDHMVVVNVQSPTIPVADYTT
jgi:hypothetical protein